MSTFVQVHVYLLVILRGSCKGNDTSLKQQLHLTKRMLYCNINIIIIILHLLGIKVVLFVFQIYISTSLGFSSLIIHRTPCSPF